MDFIFNYLSSNTAESNDLKYVFDILIKKLRKKYFDKKTINTTELFCGVLFQKILDEELKGKTCTIDDFLESKFIKNFCFIIQSDNSYGVFPFLLSEFTQFFKIVNEGHFMIETNERSFNNGAKKFLHFPNDFIITDCENLYKGNCWVNPNPKRILKRKSEAIGPLKGFILRVGPQGQLVKSTLDFNLYDLESWISFLLPPKSSKKKLILNMK